MSVLGTYSITDDTGILALVDPSEYQGYIGAQWTYEQILERFRKAMALHQMLIWETGMECIWNVRINLNESSSISTDTNPLSSNAPSSITPNTSTPSTNTRRTHPPGTNTNEVPKGFRSATGYLKTTDAICLVSYETLSMAAQFDDERVTGTTIQSFCFKLKPGFYEVTIVQLFDPKSISQATREVDFDIYLSPISTPDPTSHTWTDIAWSRF